MHSEFLTMRDIMKQSLLGPQGYFVKEPPFFAQERIKGTNSMITLAQFSWYAEAIANYLNSLGFDNPPYIIEFGPGNGVFLENLTGNYPNAHYLAVEPSPTLAKGLKFLIRNKVHILRGLLENPPFRINRHDCVVVILNEVLDNYPALACLKKNGQWYNLRINKKGETHLEEIRETDIINNIGPPKFLENIEEGIIIPVLYPNPFLELSNMAEKLVVIIHDYFSTHPTFIDLGFAKSLLDGWIKVDFSNQRQLQKLVNKPSDITHNPHVEQITHLASLAGLQKGLFFEQALYFIQNYADLDFSSLESWPDPLFFPIMIFSK